MGTVSTEMTSRLVPEAWRMSRPTGPSRTVSQIGKCSTERGWDRGWQWGGDGEQPWYAEHGEERCGDRRAPHAEEPDQQPDHGSGSDEDRPRCHRNYAHHALRGPGIAGRSSAPTRWVRRGEWIGEWGQCQSASLHGFDPRTSPLSRWSHDVSAPTWQGARTWEKSNTCLHSSEVPEKNSAHRVFGLRVATDITSRIGVERRGAARVTKPVVNTFV